MTFKDYTVDEVNTFLTVMCDFQVTQAVDGNFGVHVGESRVSRGHV